ncbi:MAG: HEAT repeat domain-containing protein [Bacteroidota bacterium]
MQPNQQKKVAFMLLGLLFLQNCGVSTSGPYYYDDRQPSSLGQALRLSSNEEEWANNMPGPSGASSVVYTSTSSGPSRACSISGASVVPREPAFQYADEAYTDDTTLRSLSTQLEAQARIKAELRAHYLREDFSQMPTLLGGQSQSVEGMEWLLQLQEQEQVVKDLHAVGANTGSTANSQEPIQWSSRLLSWEELFCPRSLGPNESVIDIHKVLVVGEAGTGKTALTKKLAHAWAKGIWGKNFDAVYVLTASALRTGTCNKHDYYVPTRHLSQVIISEYLPQTIDPRNYRYWTDGVKRQLDQPTTLVILDGLEEQWGISQTILQEAKEGRHKLLLVTRPYGIDMEKECRLVDRVVENKGLDQRNRDLFISRTLAGPTADTTADIVRFITAHHLQDIVRIPVHLQMLCRLWATRRAELTQSHVSVGLSWLCRSFLQDVWNDFIMCQIEQVIAIHGTTVDARAAAADQDAGLKELERIALHSLCESRLGIGHEQMTDLLGSSQGWILQDSNPLLAEQPGGAYMFSELIFQEYLAGKRLARFFLSGKMGTLFSFLKPHIYVPRYRRMFTFMAGEIMQETFKTDDHRAPENSSEAVQILEQLMSAAPWEVLYAQRLVLQLQLSNEWLVLIQGRDRENDGLVAQALISLESCFALGKWLTVWFEAGLRQYDIHEVSKTQLLNCLLKLFSEANGVGRYYSGQLMQLLQDLIQVEIQNTHLHCAVYKALGILGRYIPFRQVKRLLDQGIQHADENIHRAACNALKTLGQHISFRDLDSFLRTEWKSFNWRMRVATYTALGSVGQDAPIHNVAFLLQAGLQDHDESVRQATCLSLEAIGLRIPSVAIELLIQLVIQNEDMYVQECVYDVLVTIGRSLPYRGVNLVLAQGSQDENEYVRAATYKVLGAVGQGKPVAEVISFLRMGLGDHSWRVRQVTCQALERLASHISDKTAMFFLQTGIQDNNWRVRKVAYEVLGTLRLCEVSDEAESEDTRTQYLTDFMRACMKDQNCQVRVAACKSLSTLSRGAPFHWVWDNLLRQAIEDSSWAVRYAVYEGLANLDSAGKDLVFELTWPALQKGMQHANWMIRKAAYQSFKVLGRDAPFEAVWPILQKGMADCRFSVRHAAYEALVALNEKVPFIQIWPALQRCMQHTMCDVREDAYLALHILDKQGSFELVWPSLLQGVQHNIASVCEAAYKALEKYPTYSLIDTYWEVKDKDMTPFIAHRLYDTALTLENVEDAETEDQHQLVLYTSASEPIKWRRPKSEINRFMKCMNNIRSAYTQ